MAKSKNHTAHNQTYKQHKNGIKKPRKFRESSRKGVSKSLTLRLTSTTLPYSKQLLSGPTLTKRSWLQMDPKFLRNQVGIIVSH